MSKLSREQIKALTAKGYMYFGLLLLCDGHKVRLTEERYKNSIRAEVYVDGWFRGRWLNSSSEHVESKFYPFMKITVKKNPFDPKCRKRETVILDNRVSWFANIGQALRHINKVCDSVEVIEDS